MADWTFVPTADPPPDIVDNEPVTLVSRFEDKKAIRRQKAGTFDRFWSMVFELTATQADAARDFWRTKGTAVPFTMLSYDPREASNEEATVCFAGPFRWQEIGPDFFRCSIQFVEDP